MILYAIKSMYISRIIRVISEKSTNVTEKCRTPRNVDSFRGSDHRVMENAKDDIVSTCNTQGVQS